MVFPSIGSCVLQHRLDGQEVSAGAIVPLLLWEILKNIYLPALPAGPQSCFGHRPQHYVPAGPAQSVLFAELFSPS